MRKAGIIFTAVLLVATILFGTAGIAAVYSMQQREIRMVQYMAGAVLSAYPQAEQSFAGAVKDSIEKNASYEENIRYGENVLASYGYRRDMELNESYRQLLTGFIVILAVFFVCIVGCANAVFAYILEKQKKQEKKMQDTEKLAEALQFKSEALNDEHDSMKALVTDISHQLKTPVSALQACFCMYLEADSEKERTEFLTRSKIQIDKLEALTADLIQMSRLEHNMITLKKAEVSLTELLIGAVNTVYHKALKKEIAIETEEFEDIIVKLDSKWTMEAIANILDNAVKYSPAGSKIQVRITRLYSFVRIEIEDEGIGIERDEQNRIFGRFYRGGNEIVKNTEGSGVGLYLTRKILEEQGGTVSVQSEGKGSTFIVQLPL